MTLVPLALIFANLDQEMNPTIISFNFHVGSLGSTRFSDPTESGPSAGSTTIMTTSEASVGSSSEVNSLVNVKPTKIDTVEELGKIMENLDLKKSLGTSSGKKFDDISERDFITNHGDVSGNLKNTLRTEIKSHSDKQLESHQDGSQGASNLHQIYVIINDT
jgi:hypothetical protein